VESSLKIRRLDPVDKPTFWKPGIRVLGVSESFTKPDIRSVVVGVVMRGDFRIDGFGICRPKVGGRDATDQLIAMYERLGREDVRAWLLGGSMISWCKVVDIVTLHEATGIPVGCVTYNPSEGIEKYLEEYFPDDWNDRLDQMKKAGERHEFVLKSGHSVFLNSAGMSVKDAGLLAGLFTLDGRIPEPIRVARSLAYTIRRDMGK
jgi:endonuclease V-like protein UPF0215 family